MRTLTAYELDEALDHERPSQLVGIRVVHDVFGIGTTVRIGNGALAIRKRLPCVRESRCRTCKDYGKSEYEIEPLGRAYHGHATNRADARLIAAAPDLLAACKALVEHRSLQLKIAGVTVDAEDVKAGVAAIAKAEGRAHEAGR